MDRETRYAYKPNAIILALAGAFFAICTVLIYQLAQDDGGLIFDNLIELSPEQAKPVFWLLTAVSALFSLAGFVSLYRVLSRDAELVLTPTRLTVPPLPLGSRQRMVPLADIVALSPEKIGRRRMLRLQLRQGSLALAAGQFANAAAYEAFARDLQQQLAAASMKLQYPLEERMIPEER